MELGLHIADFTWSGGAAELGPTLGLLARSAEEAGVARLTVMDHVWQIAGLGPPENAMLEAYTTLGYLAGVTERVRLHALVTAPGEPLPPLASGRGRPAGFPAGNPAHGVRIECTAFDPVQDA